MALSGNVRDGKANGGIVSIGNVRGGKKSECGGKVSGGKCIGGKEGYGKVSDG